MAIRAVSLDLFDTLVDLEMENLPRVVVGGRELRSTVGELFEEASEDIDLNLDQFAEILMEVDKALRRPAYRDDRELPTLRRFEALCERMGVGVTDLPQRLTDVHMGLVAERASLPAGHRRVMEDLAERAQLALCSNFSYAPTALALLDDFGLSRHFDSIVISETVGRRKPHAEIFEVVLGELGVRPEETLHVGDNLVADVQGAAALGMPTAWITRRVRDPQAALSQYDGPPPDFQIRDLAELSDILDADPTEAGDR
jgi:HAD superfamily hydrolase (TIGR01509 family)